MLSWLAKRMLARDMARMRAGDYRPQLRRVAKDVRFRFPGDSSWATELQGRDELERWLQRFVHVGLQIFPDEVVVKGPPWRTTLAVRGTIHLKAPTGETAWDNRYSIWGRMSWGRLEEYEVYEDTQKSAQLDEYLAGVGKLDGEPALPPVNATGAAYMRSHALVDQRW
jgi:ketosteroid isomerase-like protein